LHVPDFIALEASIITMESKEWIRKQCCPELL